MTPPPLPLRTVPHVDLPRYMGDWHIIANIPYVLERGKVGTRERYTLKPKGFVAVSFFFYEENFDSPEGEWDAVFSVDDTGSNAEWTAVYVRNLRVPYRIIELDADYQWSVIGHKSRDLGWILSRTPELAPHTYEDILQRLVGHGYDPARFVKVPQRTVVVPV